MEMYVQIVNDRPPKPGQQNLYKWVQKAVAQEKRTACCHLFNSCMYILHYNILYLALLPHIIQSVLKVGVYYQDKNALLVEVDSDKTINLHVFMLLLSKQCTVCIVLTAKKILYACVCTCMKRIFCEPLENYRHQN